MADNKKHEKTALGIAYAAVVELGYTHSQLVKLNEGVDGIILSAPSFCLIISR